MTSIILIGDIHGYTRTYQKWLEQNLDPSQRSIQLGDMGLGFAGYYNPIMSQNHKFIRGNHDDPTVCRAHPNYLGEYGYLEADSLFYVGGAWSIDRQYRREGISWWREEELSYHELEQAIDLYLKTKPRFVISHEAPAMAGNLLLADLLGPYFMAKRDGVNSRTAQALEAMLILHAPEQWIFGHYHVDKEFQFHLPTHPKTKFQAIGGIMQDGEQPHIYELKF